jgi:hypothetical protein
VWKLTATWESETPYREKERKRERERETGISLLEELLITGRAGSNSPNDFSYTAVPCGPD